jgi:molybdopterin molybdotransferase
LASALEEADLIVTTGGVSVGDYDVMAALLGRLAPNFGTGEPDRLLFNKVAMRPGSPTSAAMYGGKPLIALSGNPGACFVGFQLFVRPVMRQMQGHRFALTEQLEAEMAASVTKPSPHERFVRAKLVQSGGKLFADPLAFDKSSMMASIPDADVLIRVPAGPDGAAKGSLVQVMMLPGYS